MQVRRVAPVVFLVFSSAHPRSLGAFTGTSADTGKTCYCDPMDIPKQARRWYLVMVFCVLLSFFAFAVGPTIGYTMESIQHVGLMIAVWAPTLGILGVRA